MWQSVSVVLATIVAIGGAALVLMAKRRDLARETAERNVTALTALINTRDIQLTDRTRDLDTLKAEHKQLIQVMIREVVSAWRDHAASRLLKDNARLRGHVETQRLTCPQCQSFTEAGRNPD